MARRINISEARANLPEIAKRVARTPGAVQYIEHRDLDEDLALTTAGYIHYLETMVMELKKKVTKPFVLAGSIQSDLTDEELEVALLESRHAAHAAAEAKFQELGE